MKQTTLKKMTELFIGKICTILTEPIAKSNFSDPQFADFFTGVVDSIDEDGIFTTHTLTGCKNFYHFKNVVGIIEEQVLNEQNPEHKKIINDMIKSKENKINKDTNDSKFINIDELSDLAKQ